MPFTSEKLWLSNLFIPALRRSTTVVSNSIMDQSFFDIRGGESVISLENLAQETRLSNNIQSTFFLLPYTHELDVKEYFRVLLTSALDRLCGIKFVSDNHAISTCKFMPLDLRLSAPAFETSISSRQSCFYVWKHSISMSMRNSTDIAY